MDAMAEYLLDVRSVRREVDRREACGQWVSGSSGEGGAFAMRTPEEKARRAAAGSDDEVRPLLSPPSADAQRICAPIRCLQDCSTVLLTRVYEVLFSVTHSMLFATAPTFWVVYAVQALWFCCCEA